MNKSEDANNAVYFLSLSLENVRCFGSEQTLDLSDGNGNPARWTVILGDNGVGKTTLLQMLAQIKIINSSMKKEEKKISFSKSEGGNVWKWVKRGASQLSITPSLTYRDILDTKGEDNNEFRFEYTNRLSWQIIESIPIQQELKILSNLNTIAYGATRRLTQSSLYIKGDVETTLSLFDEKAELIDAEEWFLRKDYAASKQSDVQEKAKKQFELAKETLLNILPDDVTDIKISPPDEDNPNPLLVFKTPMGYMRLGALSLGYQSMITWIVDLAVNLFERYPNSPNPIAEPAVVLIDEIDLHLHPKWQREIMGYLTERFTNTQFIVTAHSPLIVQAAEEANIVVLEREGDEVKIKPHKDAIQGWRVDQLLASDLFGEINSRSTEYEKLMTERRETLSKAKLTTKDKNRLKELKVEMGEIPTAETPEDMEAMDIIRRAAKLLEAKQ